MMKHYLSFALSTLMVAPVFAANSFNAMSRLSADASEAEAPTPTKPAAPKVVASTEKTGDKTSVTPKADAPKNESTETAGFFAVCKDKTTAAVMAGVACVTGTASFLFRTVKPSTYTNFVKAVYNGTGITGRLKIAAANKAALVGIAAATTASAVAYVYREKVAETAKNAYTWAKDKVNTYLA